MVKCMNCMYVASQEGAGALPDIPKTAAEETSMWHICRKYERSS